MLGGVGQRRTNNIRLFQLSTSRLDIYLCAAMGVFPIRNIFHYRQNDVNEIRV